MCLFMARIFFKFRWDTEFYRMMFPEKEKPEKVVRYFDEKVRKTWSDQPERFWRRLGTSPNVNVIPVSMEPLLEIDLPVGFYLFGYCLNVI